MSDETNADGLRARLSKQGEEALARLAQDLLDSPIVSGALQRGFDAREKATQAQEAAMGALNLPSAADLERLTRRVRSVGQRLEGIEDGVDRLADRFAGGGTAEERLQALEGRLASLDAAMGEIAGAIAALAASGSAAAAPRTATPRAAAAAKPAAARKPAAKRKPPAAQSKSAARRAPRKPTS